MTAIVSRPPYRKRALPKVLTELLGWLPIEFGNLQRAIPPSRARTVQVATDTPDNQDDLVVLDGTASAIIVSLPLANQCQGLRLAFVRVDATGHSVTLSATVSGVVNPSFAAQYSAKTIQSDGVRWVLLSQIV